MRVLVTGANGFVGHHLCQELEQHGHQVVRSDLPERDLAVAYNAEGLVNKSKPQYVVHLAARYGRILCRDEPHKSVADNAAATTELAAVCAKRDVPVLYASSSEVYGDHGVEFITEQSELRMPTTIYGLSKRWGEEALRLYLPRRQLCIARMNMLYGPAQLGGYGRCSLATFVKNAIAGEVFTVHRGTSRSWLYISDAVAALRQLIEGGRHGIYNLGNPALPQPMVDVGHEVVLQTGGTMVVEDPPQAQIHHKMYDSSKLVRATGWMPTVGLREGITETVAWARANQEEPMPAVRVRSA